VFATVNDLVDDFLRVELGEVVVVPRGDRHIVAVAVDGVNVCRFLELDAGITRMSVQFGEVVEHGGGIG
jgi:hypothetical protein